MAQIDKVLIALYEKGIKEIIVADNADKHLEVATKNSFSMSHIADARSACFYALGKTQTSCEPIIALVESKNIDHFYTGLVEAWFQQMPLVVVVVDMSDDTDYNLYTRCINYCIDLREKDLCSLDISMHGPTMIIVEGRYNDANTTIAQVSSLFPSNTKLYLSEDKYGALSKYMGYLCGTNEEVYCVILLSWLKYDLNIFNNRYMDNRFKLIVIQDTVLDYELRQWLEANNVKLMEGKWEQGLSALISSTVPTVYILNK